MNAAEYSEWLRHHFAAFPTAANYLARDYPEESDNPTTPTRRQILVAWHRILDGIGLDEAKRATDEMARSGEEPRRLEDHPRTVRRIALANRPPEPRRAVPTRIIDGHVAYQCPVCRDQGTVPVYHHKTLKAIRAAGAADGTLTVHGPAIAQGGYRLLCGAPNCAAASKVKPSFIATWGVPEELATYSEARDGPIALGTPDQRRKALAAWLERYPEPYHQLTAF